eukprot:2030374-Karenia_brevis.AAC.1
MQALAPNPRPLLIGIQSLALLVHRQDEISGPTMAVADGFYDTASGKSYLSALPDEYIARAILDS